MDFLETQGQLPQVWEEVLQSWPDVAQKLRPASRGEAECSDVPSLEVAGKWGEAPNLWMIYSEQPSKSRDD